MHKHANSCNPGFNPWLPRFTPMLTTQRKQLILERLRQDGQIVAKALSEELGISEDTVRRDLRELAAEGQLQRVHGGALPASKAVGNLQVREHLATDDKRALGRAGAALVQPGQVVILDGGTTSLQVVQHLPLELGASVVEAAAQLRADLYLMGVTGVHAEAGLTTGDFEEAAVKRALHQRAAETVVLASADKLGAASAFTVAPLKALAGLVVPAATPARVRNALKAAGAPVRVAQA